MIFEDYAVGKSRDSIAKLMDIRPDQARVIRNGEEVILDPEEVVVGDLIQIRPGERVPLDGIVVEGSCNLDTAALTGESVPRFVKDGDEVLSGCICMDGVVTIRAEKEFYDSTVSKILDLVENASAQKSKSEKFITVFAKYYTPIVVSLAIVVAILPPMILGMADGGIWADWIHRALTFLVISCPCALVISVPLSFFGGIGAASKKGILVKGSNYLDLLNRTDTFVFDKTGTLTKGQFAVVGVYPEQSSEDVLKLASICEKSSNHPIALSIVKYYGKDIDVEGYEITEIAGHGIKAKGHDGEIILAGNKRLMDAEGIEINFLGDEGVTIVHIARNGKYVGSISVADTIKEGTAEFIQNLKKNKCKVYMLTGDNDKIAARIANELGIEEYKANLLPQDKTAALSEILAKKEKKSSVCFAGDGINDAPVIVMADVGVSMGGVGSDSAIEAADIVLMHDDPSDLLVAKKIAAKTIRIAKQNIALALLVKISALIVSVLGIISSYIMWIAVFADVGVTFIAVLNSLRAMKVD